MKIRTETFYEYEEEHRNGRKTIREKTETYRVEPMAGQMIRGCQRVAQAPRKPAIQEQTTVRRSPRLQKQRQAEVPSAQLYLLDENNNGEKGHETLHHSNSSRSASKLVLDTSAEVRNWCRAHSNIDRAAPFVVFVLFMALMFYLASLLHAANVPSNVLKMAANAFHSLADHISHLRQ